MGSKKKEKGSDMQHMGVESSDSIVTVARSPLTHLPFIPLSYSEVLLLFCGSNMIKGNVRGVNSMAAWGTLTTTLISWNGTDKVCEFLVKIWDFFQPSEL